MSMAPPAPVPVLSDGIVSLRPLDARDIPEIVVGCQDPQVARWTTVPVPYAQQDAEEFVRLRSPGGAEEHAPTWTITVVPDDAWLGEIDLRPDGEGGAEIGYLLAPRARRAGHMVRAIRLASAWGFSALGLQAITWNALVGNDASLHAARRAGFQIPAHVFKGYRAHRGVRSDFWVGTLTPEDLAAAVRAAEGRREYLGPELTRRERDVLRHLARGEANRTIAVGLGISENTVKNHVRSILEKLQSTSRAEAVVTALRLGIVDLPS